MAFVWAKMAEVSLAKQSEPNNELTEHGDDFYQAKLHTARYYFARLLPRRLSLIATIKSGCASLFNIDEALF
jgi:hypothetical protein